MDPKFDLRIGLDFSEKEYFSGYLGPIELKEFTILGVNVNIAARLENALKETHNFPRIVLPNPDDLASDNFIENFVTAYKAEYGDPDRPTPECETLEIPLKYEEPTRHLTYLIIHNF